MKAGVPPPPSDLRGFWTATATLIGGTAFGQVLILFSAPLLTRIYTPEHFGIMAVVTAIVAGLLAVGSFRFETAIPLARDDEEASQLLILSLGFMTLWCLAAGAALWLGGSILVHRIGAPELGRWLWLIPIIALTAGAYQALSYWTIRARKFRTLSLARGGQAAAQVSLQLAGGFLGAGGLVVGYLAGQMAGAAVTARRLSWRRLRWSPSASRAAGTAHRRLALYTPWATLIDTIGLLAPPIFLAVLFSPVVSGHFALTINALAVPALVLAQPLAQVLYPIVAAPDRSAEEKSAMIGRVTATALLVGLPVFGLIVANGPGIFAVVFGPEWRASGWMGALLAPSLLLLFVSTPLTGYVLARRRERAILWFSIAMASARAGSLLLGAATGSVFLTVAALSGSTAVVYLVYVVWVMRLASVRLGPWVARLTLPTVLFVAIIGGSVAARPLLDVWLELAATVVMLGLAGAFSWRWLNPRGIAVVPRLPAEGGS